MNTLNTNEIKDIQKDIEKGQKILAAVYLVTDHLPESEPMRQTLRSLVASFVCATISESENLLRHIEILLGGASLSGLVSEKNSSIIIYEAKHFHQQKNQVTLLGNLGELFDKNSDIQIGHSLVQKDIKKTNTGHYLNTQNHPHKIVSDTKMLINKGNRQDTILSFINDRKSAVIKDIISLFPEVSEKTIQRELNTLINAGRITKRGSKRWSMYMAVNSLL